MKKKTSQAKKDFSEKIFLSSEKKPNLNETVDEKEFLSKIFNDFSNRSTPIGAAFAKTFFRTIRDLPPKFVSENSDSNWIDIIPTNTKQ